MSLYDSLILGIVQGITEFLPISSSGHLVLMQHYLGLSLDPGILRHFDVILHAGSLIAILIYFRDTWWKAIKYPLMKEHDGSPPLIPLLLVATAPLYVTGWLAADWIEMHTMKPLFVAFGFIFTGGFLVISGWYESRFAGKESIGWKQSVGAGFGQALAVLPGFSRSGLTIASGRLMGLTAKRATEFAFLLGAPALAGALAFTMMTGIAGLSSIGSIQTLIGLITAFTSSLLAMHFLIKTIKRYGVWVWALYLFVAAALIIADEMMPLVQTLPEIGGIMELRILVGILFIALFLEAVPITSVFVPGFAAMVTIGFLLRNDPWGIAASIPIGSAGLILGNLIGYIPARQARIKIRWKEKTDQKLMKTQKFFRRWGFIAVFFGGWWAPFRPFIAIAAGLGNMRPVPYAVAMSFGSVAWVALIMTGAAMLFNVTIY